MSPLVFSLAPRSQERYGLAKKNPTSVTLETRSCSANCKPLSAVMVFTRSYCLRHSRMPMIWSAASAAVGFSSFLSHTFPVFLSTISVFRRCQSCLGLCPFSFSELLASCDDDHDDADACTVRRRGPCPTIYTDISSRAIPS